MENIRFLPPRIGEMEKYEMNIDCLISGGRRILLPAILGFLGGWMDKRQELPVCLDLIADLITVVQSLPAVSC